MEAKTSRQVNCEYIEIYDGFLRKCKADKKALQRQIENCNANEQHLVRLFEQEIKELDKKIAQYENAIVFHKRLL